MSALRDIGKLSMAAIAGGLTAVSFQRPEAIRSFAESIAKLVPSRYQMTMLKNGFPVDYGKLSVSDPSDICHLYELGDMNQAIPVVREIIETGKFWSWIADNNEAVVAVLLIAQQDNVLWKKAIDQIANKRKTLTEQGSKVFNVSVDAPLFKKLQESVRNSEWDDIAILIDSGLLPNNYIKYPSTSPLIWAGAMLLAFAGSE